MKNAVAVMQNDDNLLRIMLANEKRMVHYDYNTFPMARNELYTSNKE